MSKAKYSHFQFECACCYSSSVCRGLQQVAVEQQLYSGNTLTAQHFVTVVACSAASNGTDKLLKVCTS